jgi:hypothetical protein
MRTKREHKTQAVNVNKPDRAALEAARAEAYTAAVSELHTISEPQRSAAAAREMAATLRESAAGLEERAEMLEGNAVDLTSQATAYRQNFLAAFKRFKEIDRLVALAQNGRSVLVAEGLHSPVPGAGVSIVPALLVSVAGGAPAWQGNDWSTFRACAQHRDRKRAAKAATITRELDQAVAENRARAAALS